MKKIVLMLILSLFAFSACAKPVEEVKVLKVGMELAYPPFETTDESGNPSGVSVDLAKAFGEYLGRDVEIINTNWTGLIPSLQTGEVDMVISSMTITETRKESVDFSNGYAKAYLAFLVNKNASVPNSGELNANDKTIAVKTGSTGDAYVTSNFPLATILRLDSESAAVAEVVNGNADAFIYDQLTIMRNVETNADFLSALMIEDQNAEEWGAAFAKGSDLVSSFNTFLETYTTEGGFDTLTQTHLSAEKAAFDVAGFAWFFN